MIDERSHEASQARIAAADDVRYPYFHLEARYREGLLQLAAQKTWNVKDPVVVTALDNEYRQYLLRWSQNLMKLGLHQQVILCLDNEVATLAASNGLSALTPAGDPVDMQMKIALLKSKWVMPQHLGTLKFMVPYLLLLQQFNIVIFSELDVFMFGSPITSLDWPSMSVNFAAMGNAAYKTPDSRMQIGSIDFNIGFMMFSGAPLVPHLQQFCQSWFEQHQAGDETVSKDQDAFNAQFRFVTGVNLFMFPRPYFVQRLSDVTPNTTIAHLAWATPDCKHIFLERLYSGELANASSLQESYWDMVKHRHDGAFDC